MSEWKDLLKIYGLILGAAFMVLPLFVAVSWAVQNPALGAIGICLAILPFIFGAIILYYLLKKKVTPSPYYYYYQTYNPNPYQSYGYTSYGAPPPYYSYPQAPYGYQPYGYGGYGYQYPQAQYQSPQPVRSEILPSDKDGTEDKLELPSVQVLVGILLVSIILGFTALIFNVIPLFIPCFVIGFSFPSLIWISYVYGKDIYEPEPGRVVLIALTWGMLSTIPSFIFEAPSLALPAGMAWMGAVLFAPFIEELFKPMILPFLRIKIDNELDGIIYGVTAGMGFAIMENLNYELGAAFSSAASWSITTLARGLGSTVIHAVGAGIIGYAYARYIMKKGDVTEIIGAYLFAVGLHMTWNGTLTGLESLGGLTSIYGQVTFMIIWPVIEFLILKIFLDKATHLDEAMFGPMGAKPYGKPRGAPAPTAAAPVALGSGPPPWPGWPAKPPPIQQQPQRPPEPQRTDYYRPPPGYSSPPPPSIPQRGQPAYSPPPRPEPATRPKPPEPEEDFDTFVVVPPHTEEPPKPSPPPVYPDDREEII